MIWSYFGILAFWTKRNKTCTKISTFEIFDENLIIKFSQNLIYYNTPKKNLPQTKKKKNQTNKQKTKTTKTK